MLAAPALPVLCVATQQAILDPRLRGRIRTPSHRRHGGMGGWGTCRRRPRTREAACASASALGRRMSTSTPRSFPRTQPPNKIQQRCTRHLGLGFAGVITHPPRGGPPAEAPPSRSEQRWPAASGSPAAAPPAPCIKPQRQMLATASPCHAGTGYQAARSDTACRTTSSSCGAGSAI
jgi:hypothetical protein